MRFSVSPHLGVWGVLLGLGGKGMVISMKGKLDCVCYRVTCNMCVGACACECACKCDNCTFLYGYMDMYV